MDGTSSDGADLAAAYSDAELIAAFVGTCARLTGVAAVLIAIAFALITAGAT